MMSSSVSEFLSQCDHRNENSTISIPPREHRTVDGGKRSCYLGTLRSLFMIWHHLDLTIYIQNSTVLAINCAEFCTGVAILTQFRTSPRRRTPHARQLPFARANATHSTTLSPFYSSTPNKFLSISFTYLPAASFSLLQPPSVSRSQLVRHHAL